MTMSDQAEGLEPAVARLSPTEALNVTLAATMRVLRNKVTKEHLLSAFPSLETTSLNDASKLSEMERRLLLDLPDSVDEEADIRRVTELSREELLSKASLSVETLTKQELDLLANNMWPAHTYEEIMAMADAEAEVCGPALRHDAIKTAVDERIKRAREPDYRGDESQALVNAAREQDRRGLEEHYANVRSREEEALQHALPWVRERYNLHQTDQRLQWGFVCFLDTWMQLLEPRTITDFRRRYDVILDGVERSIGARGSISSRWTLQKVHAQSSTKLTEKLRGDFDLQDFPAAVQVLDIAVVAMRAQFLSMCERPIEYQRPKDSLSEHGIRHGLLRNTFLVMDETCYDSIQNGAGWIDDMVILAVDPRFPELGHEYPEGYHGYLWVRFAQIANKFFEIRWLHEREYKLEHLWQAAQSSPRKAFVSVDEHELKMWMASRYMASVVGTKGDVLESR